MSVFLRFCETLLAYWPVAEHYIREEGGGRRRKTGRPLQMKVLLGRLPPLSPWQLRPINALKGVARVL